MSIEPNFFLAGAPKAGTTSLHRYLSQHPRIFMSRVKEPCYFACEVRPENFAEPYRQPSPDLITDWPSYLRLFQDAGDAAAIGEASVCYLWSPTAAANIAGRIPGARILMVLRDPAERAFSQYLHGVAKGRIAGGFRDHIDASLRDTAGCFRPTYPLLQFGHYGVQIRRYLAHFPSRQLHIALYEDYQRDPAGFYRGVLDFLGVDPDFVPDTSRRYREYPERDIFELAPADRRFLVDHYRDDVVDLERLLGRDLSAWLA